MHRADEAFRPLPDDWTPNDWTLGILAKLGEASIAANNFSEAINKVFPGTAAESMEHFLYCMEAIAAVALHAIEKLDPQEESTNGNV